MKTTKVLALSLCSLLGIGAAYASEDPETSDRPTVNIALDVRADFDYVKTEGVDEASSGIHGRYFNLKVNGTINSQLSYSWRQRLNKYKDAENDVFTATDWIYLTYQPTRNWALSAGKQVVLIGGYEYDAAPIDVFYACRFWNNFACYQFGASAAYITDNGRHQIAAQITNSPYQTIGTSCYSYNLFWAGNMGPLHTMWSANLVEYARNEYATFLAFGNQITTGPLLLEIDLMNRATKHHQYWFGDYSLIGKAELKATPWLTLMAKGGKDKWRPNPGAAVAVDKPFYGGGLEFFPMHGSRDLRLHAIVDCIYNNESVRNTEVNIGLTWNVNLYNRNF